MVTLNGADSGAAGAGWQRLIRPIGEGTYDLMPLLKLLDEVGYDGPFGFQAFGLKEDPLEILRKTMKSWRELNGQAAAARQK